MDLALILGLNFSLNLYNRTDDDNVTVDFGKR